jgi:hypothetical protein
VEDDLNALTEALTTKRFLRRGGDCTALLVIIGKTTI